MAKETKEERALREEDEARRADIARRAYLATVPKRLMDAQALALKVGVDVTVALTETGPSVRFFHDDNPYISDTVTYQVEEWELECLEKNLQTIKDEQDAAQSRLKLAQDVWANKLSHEEKSAIKEFIFHLRSV